MLEGPFSRHQQEMDEMKKELKTVNILGFLAFIALSILFASIILSFYCQVYKKNPEDHPQGIRTTKHLYKIV